MKSAPTKPTTRPYAQTARAHSAEATALRIIHAFINRFMTDWLDEITLDRVAHDAGTTVQTIIRRFGTKEGLMAASVETFGDQVRQRRAAPPGDLDRIIANLIEDYEQSGDPVLRMLAMEQRHPSLKTFLDIGRTGHRNWVADAFAPHLQNLPGPARERAIDLLVIATDVYTWKLLRRDMNHSKPTTQLMMKDFVSALLAGIS